MLTSRPFKGDVLTSLTAKPGGVLTSRPTGRRAEMLTSLHANMALRMLKERNLVTTARRDLSA
jgi:hypothetical protein